MKVFGISLLLGFLAGLANLLGGILGITSKRVTPGLLKYFVAFGAGFLLAAAFLKMIPISFEQTRWAPMFVLAGYFLIHFFEHTVTPHFHFGEEIHLDEIGINSSVGLSALFGLTVHALFDGVSISSGYIFSPALGLLIFAAIILHKLPEGFTISSIMLAAGGSKKRALMSSAMLGGATILGAVAMHSIGDLFGYALAVSAGVSIYVAASDLIPEVNKEKGILMSVMVFVGVGLFYLTEILLEKLNL